MDSKTTVTIQCTVAERNTLKAACDLERRTISNFSLLSALDRAKTLHGLEPSYSNDEGYVKTA